MVSEIYISVDIEADGPIPGDYSMISLGSVAFDESGNQLDTFQMNLLPLEGAKQHPNTMAWWKTQPEAWDFVQRNRKDPLMVMQVYQDWVNKFSGTPVFVGYPAVFDFQFVYWYLIHFVGSSPFGFNAIDIKTYAMAYMGTPFKRTVKSILDKKFGSDRQKHTHIAWEDALEQGQLFFGIREALKELRG